MGMRRLCRAIINNRWSDAAESSKNWMEARTLLNLTLIMHCALLMSALVRGPPSGPGFEMLHVSF